MYLASLSLFNSYSNPKTNLLTPEHNSYHILQPLPIIVRYVLPSYVLRTRRLRSPLSPSFSPVELRISES